VSGRLPHARIMAVEIFRGPDHMAMRTILVWAIIRAFYRRPDKRQVEFAFFAPVGRNVAAMTTETKFLAASVILGLVHLLAASHLISFQYGYGWTASRRDEPVPPLHGLANRFDQATTNFLETFPFFAALVLAICFTNRQSSLSIWGGQLYFWGRCGYLLAAALGYGLMRSALFWNTALAGIALLLVALLT
jgi:uncharacterized MAPEG superfamily protein